MQLLKSRDIYLRCLQHQHRHVGRTDRISSLLDNHFYHLLSFPLAGLNSGNHAETNAQNQNNKVNRGFVMEEGSRTGIYWGLLRIFGFVLIYPVTSTPYALEFFLF